MVIEVTAELLEYPAKFRKINLENVVCQVPWVTLVFLESKASLVVLLLEIILDHVVPLEPQDLLEFVVIKGRKVTRDLLGLMDIREKMEFPDILVIEDQMEQSVYVVMQV